MRILEKIERAIKREQNRRYRIVKADFMRAYQMREKYSKGVTIPAFILVEQRMKNIMANNELDIHYRRIIAQNRRMAA